VRSRIVRVAALVVACVLAAAALWLVLWRGVGLNEGDANDGYVRAPGVVHVHTTLSDGGGTPEEVVAAARSAGLAFIAITDHNNVDAKPFEGVHDGVLVLAGSELSTTAGHIVALGIPDPAFRFSGDGLDGLEDVRDLGGIAFAAHPLSPRPDLGWTGWDLPGPWGLELMNGDSEWRRAGGRLFFTAALYALNHRYALLRSLNAPAATLSRWDELLRQRNVPGIIGADAHSRIPVAGGFALRLPSYESLFSLARNYVLLDAPLTGVFADDARAVLEALRRGRSYVGIDALAPADGFSFVAEGRGARWTMGESPPLGTGLKLRAGGRVPRGAQVVLFRDGLPVQQRTDSIEASEPAPGVYRVEVRVPGWKVPWVISNPIVVQGRPEHAAREARAGWPPEPKAPPAERVLESFEGRSVFQPEFDASSNMNAAVLDRRAGQDGRGAGRLEFRLGEPGPDRPYTWCALVNRQARDLSDRSGLVFAIRADGVYRAWVQVRDENPFSADEGTEWWFASVRTSPSWRRVALPFSRLRSINKQTDGKLDLDKVRQLVFVIDGGAVKPGTKGTIWIDEVGVY
jgi:hypothetical protein